MYHSLVNVLIMAFWCRIVVATLVRKLTAAFCNIWKDFWSYLTYLHNIFLTDLLNKKPGAIWCHCNLPLPPTPMCVIWGQNPGPRKATLNSIKLCKSGWKLLQATLQQNTQAVLFWLFRQNFEVQKWLNLFWVTQKVCSKTSISNKSSDTTFFRLKAFSFFWLSSQ